MKKEYQKYWLCGIIGAVCFGIDTFCMNAGLIIWFVYLIAAKAER